MGGQKAKYGKWNDKTQSFDFITEEQPVFINAVQNQRHDWNATCFKCNRVFIKKHARYYRNPFYPVKLFCSQNHKLDWISSISNF